MKTMGITKEEHKASHERLRASLDMLVADFIMHHDDKRPSNTTVMELIEWSHKQTINPVPRPGTKHYKVKL